MLKEVYRVCPKCGMSNDAEANFCLKCGTKLTDADKKPLLKHSGRFTDVLAGLDISAEERQAAEQVEILTGGMPDGAVADSPIYAESVGNPGDSLKTVTEQLIEKLYSTAVSLNLGGIANLKINTEVVPGVSERTVYLLAYGDGFIRAQH
ncbi:zinc ribbon domain-containing protein [Lentilactobacillus otakiensis]|uniref:zinc ribbon domain-containing protein n=1 Tax=Lentilactobacillus otakiensis TaxID=481720 RepID=UPI003D177EB8